MGVLDAGGPDVEGVDVLVTLPEVGPCRICFKALIVVGGVLCCD